MVLDFERAGLPKVGKEFVTEAHDEEPDIPSHLWSCNEKAPDDKKEGGIKEVVNVPEPEKQTQTELKQCQIPFPPWAAKQKCAFSWL